MISDKMKDAINKQVNAELYSSYLYLSMGAYFEDKKLPGFAHWMRAQASEELLHAMKFYHYLIDQDARIALLAIDQPPTDWQSPRAVFEEVLKHEQKVTGLINGLATLAKQEDDHASGIFLQWFVAEQVEEEASARAVLDKLELAGDSGYPLLLLDNELGQRPPIFTLPIAPGGGAAE